MNKTSIDHTLRFSLKRFSLGAALAASLASGLAQAQSTVIWDLAGSGSWNTSSTNWLDSVSNLSTTFSNGDAVIFDNTAGGSIAIEAGVAPLSTTVSAPSGTYTFAGGPLAAGSLTKSGGSILKIEANNTYDGGTIINGGTLEWRFVTPNTNEGLGSGPIVLNDGTFYLWRVNPANSLTRACPRMALQGAGRTIRRY